MPQNDSDRIKKRKDQINEYKKYKMLIVDTYILSEIELLKNEDLIEKLKKDIEKLIKSMLKYYEQNGFAFIFALFTDNNIYRHQQLTQPKSYLNQLIISITNIIKFDSLINPFKQQLLHFSQSIIKIIEQIKLFLQSLPQGHQIKPILQDLLIFTAFPHDIYKQEKNTSIYNVSSERSLKFIKLMEKIYKAKNKIRQQGTQSTKMEIYLQTGYEIMKMYPQNIFEEVTINRLKKITEKFLINHQSQALLPYCCTFYFRKQLQYIKMQSKNHQHKDYHWPITLEKILKHVRKTIVGFLNLEGGIIYIGMKQKPQCVQAKGIFLSQEQVVGFFTWLYGQCSFIYPKVVAQAEKEMKQMKQNLESLRERQNQKKYHYHVNKYMAVEFLTMIDQDTNMDIVEENSDVFRKLYMLKIKIKPGTKAETFHLLKQDKDGEIQCYKRNDTSVNKLTFAEFINFYNQRIETFMNETVQQPEALWDKCPFRHFKQFCKKSLL